MRLRLQFIRYDLQHSFARVADESDRSVVLALLQVAFLVKCDYRGFVGWRSALWCSILHWNLPVHQRWSSPLVASNCLQWSSAWLCSGGWWEWSFGSSGAATGCLSWEVWWQRTGSTGLAILLYDRSVLYPSVQYFSFFCEAFSWTILDRSRFLLFHGGQVFQELVFLPVRSNDLAGHIRSGG